MDTTWRQCKEWFRFIRSEEQRDWSRRCFCWRLLEGFENNFIEDTDRSCGWTKGSARHTVTWWWNVINSVSGDRKLCEK